MSLNLTQARLKKLLSYDPSTGVFVRLTSPSNSVKKGDLAGHLNVHGYYTIMIDRVAYLSHRLAFLYMTGSLPPVHCDHINHIRDDNRWVNLRLATPTQNAMNQSLSCANTSGYTGVSWNKAREKWEVSIQAHKKRYRLGNFSDLSDAVAVRKKAEKIHGFHKNHGVSL